MKISEFFSKSKKKVKSNSPEILTALAVSGVISTAYLTAKASFQASKIIQDKENLGRITEDEAKVHDRLVWKCYVPPVLSGVLTIGCIIGSSKANGKRTAAAVTAYSLTERAFSEYREKVVEQIGKGKEQELRDTIAQDRVNKNPANSREVIIVGNGTVLCCELHTNRYFRSDMESLRKAQNDINAKIVNDVYVPLDEFYELIGLPYTSSSNNLGWTSDKLMELQFSTVLSEGGEPCLAFDYNYTKPLT